MSDDFDEDDDEAWGRPQFRSMVFCRIFWLASSLRRLSVMRSLSEAL